MTFKPFRLFESPLESSMVWVCMVSVWKETVYQVRFLRLLNYRNAGNRSCGKPCAGPISG